MTTPARPAPVNRSVTHPPIRPPGVNPKSMPVVVPPAVTMTGVPWVTSHARQGRSL
jgi:hypothetical protein